VDDYDDDYGGRRIERRGVWRRSAWWVGV